jgi:Spy/CpxP family protein refolding chaperone
MKKITVATILSVALYASSPIMAGEGDRDSHGGSHAGMRSPGAGIGMHGVPDPERMVRHISSWLELDEAQTQELANVVLAARPQLLALREKALVNREAIAALDGSASDYGVNIHNLAVENGQIATEMTLLISQLRVDIHSKLTEEQRQMLAEGADRMRHRRDGKRRAQPGETELQAPG